MGGGCRDALGRGMVEIWKHLFLGWPPPTQTSVFGEEQCTHSVERGCCFEAMPGPEGCVVQVKFPWATGLISTVREEATQQQVPTVLVEAATGNGYVAILALGPLLLGWPLRSDLCDDHVVLRWIPDGKLEQLFLRSPFAVNKMGLD